jgi:phenylacetic acid degradation operon negative regulatory protein
MAGSVTLMQSLLALGGEMAGHGARAILERTTKAGRIDRALQRLATAGVITVAGQGPIDQRILRLTEAGRLETLGGIDPEAAWARPWDGIWRVVAFDIPEIEEARRTRLRRRLHEFRFGWLQNSVWISPHPIDAFRAGLDEAGIAPDFLTYFEARCAGGESPTALVKAAWDFEDLTRRYTDYRQILQARPSAVTGTASAWLRWLHAEHKAWRLAAGRDPFLPGGLLPTGYAGRAAWAARIKALAEFAQAWH